MIKQSPRAGRVLRPISGLAAMALTIQVTAQAQIATPPPAQTPSAPANPRAADPVLGSVDGRLIYLSDLSRAAKSLPEQLRDMPFETVMPVLLDRMIDHEALAMIAQRKGFDKRPDVEREVRAARDNVLESAWLEDIIREKVTDPALLAAYNRQYANRPATDEVRARHILAGTEAEAKKVVEELRGGADFATIARAISKDPDGRNGGDLGFFRRDQVWPAFADVAFSLQPGQIAPAPVHNEFGWHVIKVEEKRLVAPPTFTEVREQIRQAMIAAAVRDAIADARSKLIIHRFNLDGSDADAPRRAGAPDRDSARLPGDESR